MSMWRGLRAPAAAAGAAAEHATRRAAHARAPRCGCLDTRALAWGKRGETRTCACAAGRARRRTDAGRG
eukprot:283270-Chlamydomonas_euryale.AAC.1